MGYVINRIRKNKKQKKEEAVISYYQDLLVIKNIVEEELDEGNIIFTIPRTIGWMGDIFFKRESKGDIKMPFYASEWGYRKLCFYIKVCQWTLKKIYHWTDKDLEAE